MDLVAIAGSFIFNVAAAFVELPAAKIDFLRSELLRLAVANDRRQ
jgi:hypothetical protein